METKKMRRTGKLNDSGFFQLRQKIPLRNHEGSTCSNSPTTCLSWEEDRESSTAVNTEKENWLAIEISQQKPTKNQQQIPWLENNGYHRNKCKILPESNNASSFDPFFKSARLQCVESKIFQRLPKSSISCLHYLPVSHDHKLTI